MANQNVYIVASFTNTFPGKLIQGRAKLKFWNRYPGDYYSHISLSRDSVLDNMMSFARKELQHPYPAGLVKEDIRKDMFALRPDISQIAVMELPVTDQQYQEVDRIMEAYWARREELNFNYIGLAVMLILGKGVSKEGSFFCSEWVTTVLKEAGVDFLPGKSAYNVRPFDIYGALREYIVYEGLTVEYPEYDKPKEKTLITPNSHKGGL